MTLAPPPADLSGGFMTVSYTNGSDTHRQRLHVFQFSTTAFWNKTTSVGSATDDGNHDYAYNSVTGGPTEQGIVETFNAYAAKWAALYPASWNLTLLNLYQNVNNVLTEIALLPVTAIIPGTSAGTAVVGLQRAGELILNIKTVGGNRARLIFIANVVEDPGEMVPVAYSPTTGPSVAVQAMLGYVSSVATAIRGHDGTRLTPNARATGVINRRLRRHYGYA